MGNVKVKVCIDCQEEKPLDDFYYQARRKDSRGSYCKRCSAIRRRKLGDSRFGGHPYKEKTKSGHIYIISNPAWDGYLKIGVAKNLTNRLRQYQTTSPFRDFVIEYSTGLLDDAYWIEWQVHDYFDSRYEWSQAPLNEIIEYIISLL